MLLHKCLQDAYLWRKKILHAKPQAIHENPNIYKTQFHRSIFSAILIKI